MTNEEIEVILNDYNSIVINKYKNYIDAINIGFVYNLSCNSTLLIMLHHCIENSEIFNDEQFNNIIILINKIK